MWVGGIKARNHWDWSVRADGGKGSSKAASGLSYPPGETPA